MDAETTTRVKYRVTTGWQVYKFDEEIDARDFAKTLGTDYTITRITKTRTVEQIGSLTFVLRGGA